MNRRFPVSLSYFTVKFDEDVDSFIDPLFEETRFLKTSSRFSHDVLRIFARSPLLFLQESGRPLQTVATAVFMEMKRGSLNPLFTRRPRRLYLSTYLPHPFCYLHLGIHPHLRMDFFHFRLCRFTRFISSPRPTALVLFLSFSLHLIFLRRRSSSSLVSRGQNPRAQLPPLFAHLITRNS